MRFMSQFLPFFTRRIRIGLMVCAGLLVLFGLFGFLALPALLRPWLEKEASAALHREVRIGKIEINPYLLRVVLRDVAVNEKDGALLQFAALTADAEFASLWRRGPVLREITLESPRLHIERVSADRYNFSDLLELQSKTPAEKDAPLPRFSLNNIRITGGNVDFDDRFESARQQVSDLQLSLPFVSTLSYKLDEYIEPGLSGKLNGASFKLVGQSKPFKDSHETRLSLQLDHLNLPHYLAYVPLPRDVNLPSGSLSGQVDVVFREERDQPRLLIQGKLGLADGRLDYRGEPILQLPALNVELGSLEPLLQKYRLARIGIDKPVLTVARDARGELNWLTAFAAGTPAASNGSAPAAAAPPVVEVADFALNDGRIDWKDAAVKPAYAASVEAISLKAQHFSTAAKASMPVEIAFKSGFGETFNAALQVQASPLVVDGRVALDNIQPGRYPPYLKPYFAGEIAGGQLSSVLNLHFAADPQVLEISQGAFGIQALAIKLAGEKQPALKLAALNASGIGVNLGKQLVEVASLNISGSENRIVMGKDGRINLQNLLPPASAKPSAASKDTTPPWRIKLAQLALEKSALRLEDQRQGGTPPLVLSYLGLRAENLDSVPGSTAKLDFSAKAGKRGLIKVAGPFVPQPFSAKWQLELRQFDAAFAQPYFTDYLNIQLASIWLGARGEAQIATVPRLAVRYRGNLAVNDLHAIDKLNGEDFLKWRSLALTGADVQTEPFKLALREVALSDFYSRLILSKEGKLNLEDIVVKEGQATSVTSPAPAAPTAKPAAVASAPVAPRAPLPPINIGKITLTGGNINYTDNFIQPNFTANLMDMGGVIGGLSSNETARASLDLRGSVDRIAPVTIAGSLNPLAQKMFLDIKAAVKGYELTAASTYSAKYAGYGIEKGKLSMDVAYFIENNQLKATNQLVLDQLTLGEKVESPDATKLPVKFALALLTDRRGQINLNLPIEGSLDDPQFRIGKIIWQVIGNLLEKAVTAPFSALGSLFGGNEAAFSRVEFEPGSSALPASAKDALAKLAKALDDRPALKLDIAGWVEPELDREGLKHEKLEEKIRARKLAQLADKGQSVDTKTELVMTAAERVKLLAQVYDREKFPKPRNAVGLQKSLPPEEMEKLILANTPVSEDELRNLGLQRATVVKDALEEAKVDESRLFILKPRLDPPADELKKDGGKATRVQFVLK